MGCRFCQVFKQGFAVIRLFKFLAFFLLLITQADSAEESSSSTWNTELPTRIAFGSCADQEKPQPVLNKARERDLDFFIFLGDNIYGDSHDMQVLRDKYAKLGAKPEFQALWEDARVLSIWDDHDYGENDAGREYPMKEQSQEIFLDFWRVPADSPRRQRPGIYGAHRFIQGDRALQIILLDTRFFRDSLKANPDPLPENYPFKNVYQPDATPQKTLLGESQWKWLEEQLSKPADVRIICSSIQFSHEYNGWESWTNLPVEQKRMMDLIRKTRANGVVFISGDVHWGEISRRVPDKGYPIYDVTASGITEDWEVVESNQYRVGDQVVQDNHFGMLTIDWDRPVPQLTMEIIDVRGVSRIRHSVELDKLRH